SWTDQQADQPSSGRRIYEVEWSLETAEQQPQPQTPSSWRLNTSELSARLVGLRPSTAYSVRVRCLALASDQTVVPSSFSLRASFSTEPEAPGSPPRDLKISRSTLPMSVMLSWLPPLEPNGKITKYTVLYRPVSSNSAKPAGSEHAMPTAETQVVITGLRPSTHYYFRVRAGNSEGFGPDSDAIELSDGAESDGLSSRRWWLLIGGVFGLALLLWPPRGAGRSSADCRAAPTAKPDPAAAKEPAVDRVRPTASSTTSLCRKDAALAGDPRQPARLPVINL
uniref:Fibronectin type-III domain-containing protein n=1 Tax=Macrostomum lignano TaxID=282301 RepID=A0A1I8GF53_9PLAT